jgi:hypothetical protein
MNREPDEAIEVLREVWSAQGQTSADLDDASGTKSCKRMADVGFDGLAGDGGDMRAAWRHQLEREGKLNAETGSVRDLVLGPGETDPGETGPDETGPDETSPGHAGHGEDERGEDSSGRAAWAARRQ